MVDRDPASETCALTAIAAVVARKQLNAREPRPHAALVLVSGTTRAGSVVAAVDHDQAFLIRR